MGIDEIKTRGIVLDNSPQNEYDKRLVILTTDLGRITVFANGARRSGSRFAAVSQKYVMAELTLRAGRNAYTLTKATIIRPFLELSEDIEKMCYASYMCELMSYFTREGLTAVDELNLLYVSFVALLQSGLSEKLIRCIFECKLLDIEGEGFQKEEYKKHGGHLSPTAEYTISYILSRELTELYDFDLKPEILEEISEIIFKYTKKHCDYKFKSLDILSTLM